MLVQSGWKVKVWPGGQVSMGYVAPRGYDFKYEVDKNAFRYGSTWWCGREDIRRWEENRIMHEEEAPPLDLTTPANSHKRGLNGITSDGRRVVRSAAYMLQKKYGRRRLSFLTLTLPSLSLEDESLLAREWSRVLRVFGQKLKRKLQAVGLPGNYVGVTEIQGERIKAGKGIGLHLHLVFVGKRTCRSGWALNPREFREMWCSVLSTVLGRHVWSDYCENVKVVEKDASAYLGKYMSKGTSAIAPLLEKYGDESCPSAWYMCTSPMRKAVRRAVKCAWDSDLGLLDQVPSLCDSSAIRGVSLSFIQLGEQKFLVGISFSAIADMRHVFPEKIARFIFDERKKRAA